MEQYNSSFSTLLYKMIYSIIYFITGIIILYYSIPFVNKKQPDECNTQDISAHIMIILNIICGVLQIITSMFMENMLFSFCQIFTFIVAVIGNIWYTGIDNKCESISIIYKKFFNILIINYFISIGIPIIFIFFIISGTFIFMLKRNRYENVN